MTLFDTVHFSRPYWLFVLPITWFLLATIGWRHPHHRLKTVVASHLLSYINAKDQSSSWQKWLGLLSVNLLIVGLAGISFDKQPTELFSPAHKTVFIVDQSLSLYATDIRPNRLTKAKQVLRDILDNDIEGDLALVAFAGDAYVVSPFTQDHATLTHFLVALDPRIMPLYGSQLDQGLQAGLELVEQQDYAHTTFIILTDDLSDDDTQALTQTLAPTGIDLKLIAVGTAEGGPIRLPDGQLLRHQGLVVTPKVPLEALQQATQQANGEFYQASHLSPQQLSQLSQLSDATETARKTDITGSTWREQGHWFALPFVCWLLWQFNGGALLLCLVLMLPFAPDSQASLLDRFKTNDQKAQQAADQGLWQEAADLFENPKWQAASLYASESYQAAAERLEPIAQTANDFYNLGNSRALANDLTGAIDAYNTALQKQPDFTEARQNLNYLKQLLERQQAQESEQNNDENNDDDASSSPSQGTDSDQQSSDQASQEPQQNDPSDQTQDNSAKNADNQTQPPSQANPSERSQDGDLSQEEQQALEQWLRQIQDDPGTLLQRKLWHLHQQRRNENRYNQEDGQQPW